MLSDCITVFIVSMRNKLKDFHFVIEKEDQRKNLASDCSFQVRMDFVCAPL